MTDPTYRDPDIAGVRALLAGMAPAAGAPAPTMAERRAGTDAFGAMVAPLEGCASSPLEAPGVRGMLFHPTGADEGRALLYLHGGGYVTGSSASHGHFAARLAAAMDGFALALDYRLAPEHPFPAAVEDAVAGYRWLLARGVSPTRIAVAGDSAGGGLTVALALALKAAGLPQPGALHSISPWVDLAQSGETYAGPVAARDPMITRAGLDEMAGHYLAGTPASEPLASPIHGDLSSIAPLYIQCGGDEALLSDSLALARLAALAGVEVRLEIWPEMIHVWPVFHQFLGAGRRALAEAGAWMRERTR